MDYILNLLEQIAYGITTQFGTNCEIVIHDLRKKDIESSIVYIENGHMKNRVADKGPSEFILKALHENPDNPVDQLAYLTKLNNNRILKSSTMYIRGENHRVEYIFCLNYDITGLLAIDESLRALTDIPYKKSPSPPKIAQNVNDLLDELIEQSVKLVGKPVSLMTKDDKVKAIQYLNSCGAFLITKSGDKVSKYFGISKFTLYSYMDSSK